MLHPKRDHRSWCGSVWLMMASYPGQFWFIGIGVFVCCYCGAQSFKVMSITSLGAFVTLLILLISRFCAPCCCANDMPDVPPPCPQGECSCNNLIVLDYPLIFAFAGDAILGTILDFSSTFVVISDPEGWETVRYFRMINLLWAVLAFVGVYTGLRKYRLMNERIVSIPPSTPGVVVGTPVTYGQNAVAAPAKA